MNCLMQPWDSDESFPVVFFDKHPDLCKQQAEKKYPKHFMKNISFVVTNEQSLKPWYTGQKDIVTSWKKEVLK